MRNLICAIVGRRVIRPEDHPRITDLANDAGKIASLAGFTVLTGGKHGAMEAACDGAHSVDGKTIALLPNNKHEAVIGKDYDFVLPTPMGIMRNALTASMCDIMIAVPGGSGTLEEILFATDFGRPVILFSEWCNISSMELAVCHSRTDLQEWVQEQRERLVNAE
jgi:hypothetical protein